LISVNISPAQVTKNEDFFGSHNKKMAGRILPIALATVVGVSIGVATFDGELKEQRRKRLQEDYERWATLMKALIQITKA
jgi:hypothetical protein